MDSVRTLYSLVMKGLHKGRGFIGIVSRGRMLSLVELAGCVALMVVRPALADPLPTLMRSVLDAHNSYRSVSTACPH